MFWLQLFDVGAKGYITKLEFCDLLVIVLGLTHDDACRLSQAVDLQGHEESKKFTFGSYADFACLFC